MLVIMDALFSSHIWSFLSSDRIYILNKTKREASCTLLGQYFDRYNRLPNNNSYSLRHFMNFDPFEQYFICVAKRAF